MLAVSAYDLFRRPFESLILVVVTWSMVASEGDSFARAAGVPNNWTVGGWIIVDWFILLC